jgi:hypothetical protein
MSDPTPCVYTKKRDMYVKARGAQSSTGLLSKTDVPEMGSTSTGRILEGVSPVSSYLVTSKNDSVHKPSWKKRVGTAGGKDPEVPKQANPSRGEGKRKTDFFEGEGYGGHTQSKK